MKKKTKRGPKLRVRDWRFVIFLSGQSFLPERKGPEGESFQKVQKGLLLKLRLGFS
jgi:hypothetical protein